MKLAIFISGRGSNMQAICQAVRNGQLPLEIVAIVSDNPQAPGLIWAQENSFPIFSVSRQAFKNKEAFETAIVMHLREKGTTHIALAGYMRVIGPTLLSAYPNRIINIHPSLLPAFPGLHPQQQALDAGVQESGCTVHFVNDTVDGGPIIRQAIVPVLPGDTADSLSARILEAEHRLYPAVLDTLLRTFGTQKKDFQGALPLEPLEKKDFQGAVPLKPQGD